MRRFSAFFVLVILSLSGSYSILAGDEWVSGVYITGINCPNCAKADPVVLGSALESNPKLIIFEFEMHKYGEANRPVAIKYFQSYFPKEAPGIPALIFGSEKKGIGRHNVTALAEDISEEKKVANPFPENDGSSKNFKDLNLNDIEGLVQIWHRNRMLIPGNDSDSEMIKAILVSENIERELRIVKHEEIEPFNIQVASGHISFDKSVKIGEAILLWKTGAAKKNAVAGTNEKDEGHHVNGEPVSAGTSFPVYMILIILIVFLMLYMIDRKNMIKAETLTPMTETQKNLIVVGSAFVFLAGFFLIATTVSPSAIEEMGYQLPLPVFTLAIALVDGFNPCNMFVLTFLMALIVSSTHSRLRIYIVGYSFVLVVYIVYFFFMAAWLNIFKYIGFIDPLRITIALIALVAGFINCKELLFFKKGISLTTGEKGRSFLDKKTRKVRGIIKNGSIPVLIGSSITLGFFASLIELPCTAGFPIVYTTVLSGLDITQSSFTHYFWIAIYNLFYIIPLAVIIFIFGYTFRGKAISEAAVQRMKFIGGFIMIILGIILLVNPAMIGIGM